MFIYKTESSVNGSILVLGTSGMSSNLVFLRVKNCSARLHNW